MCVSTAKCHTGRSLGAFWVQHVRLASSGQQVLLGEVRGYPNPVNWHALAGKCSANTSHERYMYIQ
jgi:hypothetical protein